MQRKIRIAALLLAAASQFAFSQIREEQLILDRKREPAVTKIEKKQSAVSVEKNYPPKEKRVQDSMNLHYEITDVPAVSDFKTSAIQGADISPTFTSKYHRNYFRAGVGNYGKLLADASFINPISDKNDLGIDFHHISTTGLKSDYPWKSSQQNLTAAAFIDGRNDSGKYNVTANYQNDSYDYYGIYAFNPAADTDLKQSVNRFGIRGFYDFYDNPVLEKIAVRTGFLNDHFSSKENTYQVQAKLKHEWDLKKWKDTKISLEGDTEFKGLNAKFGILDRNTANHFIVQFSPMVRLKMGESFLAIGANMNWISQHNEVLREDSSSSDFSVIPQVEAQYFVRPELVFFGNLDGGIALNSYGELLRKNPYLVSNQILKPTDTKYRINFGIKGDIGKEFKYNLGAAYSELDDIAMFRQSGIFTDINTFQRPSYDYLNTFSTDYFAGKLAEVKAEAVYFLMQNLSVDAELNFAKYSLENDQKMYNMPVIKSTVSVKYTTLADRLLLGFTGIFASGTTAEVYSVGNDPVKATEASVSGFADLNLSAEYRFHKNFSIFALGNNLLNQKYQNFYGYRNLGAQILGGVKISF